jgi:hypothetical protein
MSEQGKGTISPQDLMSKLVQAKKVMNKVDGGNYERGNINENLIKSAPEEFMQQDIPVQNTRPVNNGQVNISKIQNSKLPDAIKKAMIENPIQQISLNDTLDMDFLKGAKRLMEQENVLSKSSKQQVQQPKYNNTPSQSIDMTALATLVENTVRKVMDEKLNQLLSAQQTQSINENLVLKVGDSVFKGKITGVNKAK